jgi:hypothetical protein
MFWNRKSSVPAPSALTDAEHMHAMAAATLEASGLALDTAPKDESRVLMVFFFGMASAHGMLNKLPQEQTVALARGAYQSAFKLKLVDANKAVQEGLKSTKPGPHQKMTPVLHAGIDGQAMYANGNQGGLAALLAQQLDRVRQAKA